jgi:hypothetical protein
MSLARKRKSMARPTDHKHRKVSREMMAAIAGSKTQEETSLGEQSSATVFSLNTDLPSESGERNNILSVNDERNHFRSTSRERNNFLSVSEERNDFQSTSVSREKNDLRSANKERNEFDSMNGEISSVV